MELSVRAGAASDVPALTGIFNAVQSEGFAVFDERPVTVEERRTWFAQYSGSGPHRICVAEDRGRVLGWASSQRYREHPAFRQCVETSIMLAPAARGRGLGRRLYAALFAILDAEPIHRVYAGVALPNPASVALHKAFGFELIAVYDEYAVKNGRYVSSAWFERRQEYRRGQPAQARRGDPVAGWGDEA